MSNKKYFWLKLKEDFFKQKELKKLRNVAGGDTYTIIYLKMQLLSLKNNGKLIYDGIEDTFAEELSLELDETVDNIKMTLAFLQQTKLIEEVSDSEFILPSAINSMGSETDAAERMRRHRASKINGSDCNNSVTGCNNVTENRNEVSQSSNLLHRDRERDRSRERVDNTSRVNEKQNPANSDSLKELHQNKFKFWKERAKKYNFEFTQQEWNYIYGYVKAKPNMSQHAIDTSLLLLHKWADEDGLDIGNTLLQSQVTKTLITPTPKFIIDANGKKNYNVRELRLAIIRKEKEEFKESDT